MKSKWVEYNGQRILYCDYRSLGVDDLDKLKEELACVEELIQFEPPKSTLSITDVRDSVATTDAVNAMRKAAISTGKHVRKQAVIGVTGLKKIFFDAIVRISGQQARTFDDLESAEAWLVSKE